VSRHPIDADGYFSGDPHSGRNRDLTPAVVGSRAVVGLQCLLSTGRHHGHHGHGAFIDAGTIVTSPLNGPSPFSATTQPVTTELAGISVDPTLTVMPTPNTSACAEGTTMNLATPGTMTPPNPTGAPATTGVCPHRPAADGKPALDTSRNGKAPLGNRVRYRLGMMPWCARTID
jgi:hypothetical protein